MSTVGRSNDASDDIDTIEIHGVEQLSEGLRHLDAIDKDLLEQAGRWMARHPDHHGDKLWQWGSGVPIHLPYGAQRTDLLDRHLVVAAFGELVLDDVQADGVEAEQDGLHDVTQDADMLVEHRPWRAPRVVIAEHDLRRPMRWPSNDPDAMRRALPTTVARVPVRCCVRRRTISSTGTGHRASSACQLPGQTRLAEHRYGVGRKKSGFRPYDRSAWDQTDAVGRHRSRRCNQCTAITR